MGESDILQIMTYPDDILRAKSETIENIDDDLQVLIDCMGKTMYAAPGIGLAANQVGETKRVLVYDINPLENGNNLSVLINPEIVHAEGEIIHEEACLSVIDFSAEVSRYSQVQVQGFDRHGKPLNIEAEGLLAVCLQHEIDHLNGLLFIDHISGLKRSLYKKRLKKLQKKGASTL
jgi:peptide deformylase